MRNIIARSEKLTLTLTKTEGTEFTCTWDFGDHSPRLNMTYDDYLSTKGVTTHRYDDIGTFKVTVLCKNRLQSIVLDESVSVYDPVSPFKVRTGVTILL